MHPMEVTTDAARGRAQPPAQMMLGEPGLNTPPHMPGLCSACDRARAVLGHTPACCPAPRPPSQLDECPFCGRVLAHAPECRFARHYQPVPPDRARRLGGDPHARTRVVGVDIERRFEVAGEPWACIVVYGTCWHPNERAGRVKNLPRIGDLMICDACLCLGLTRALNRGRFERRTGARS